MGNTAREPRDDPNPKDAYEAMTLALDRASELYRLMQREGIPMSYTTMIALTVMAATHASMHQSSMVDAFSLYLGVYQSRQMEEQEQLERLAEALQDSIRGAVARLTGLPKGTMN